MSYAPPVEKHQGKIRETTIGEGATAVTVGGETTLPFHTFEGEIPHRPRIAMEVFDVPPGEWPDALLRYYGDILSDPVAWAKRCVEQYGAEMICVQLAGTDPAGANRSPEEAAATVKAVSEAVDVPLIVMGTGSLEKDGEVLKKVAEVMQGKRIMMGPALQDNNTYKQIAAAALAYDHTVMSSTPIDVNLAKQLNILITNLGVSPDKLAIDPSTGGQSLGYGLEYCYSVMERDRLAALQQNDAMMQAPLVCNLAREVWKAKEARAGDDEYPQWGDAEKRGILWEAMTAAAVLMAGGNILIMRHPEAIRLTRKLIDELSAARD